MKTKLFNAGVKFLGDMIAGSGKTINGAYIEYADSEQIAVDDKSKEYFDELLRSDTSGFGRIPVKNITCDEDGIVHISCVVAPADLKGGRIGKNTKLVSATLVYMQDDIMSNDTILYSTVLTTPVKVVKGVYNYIEISFSLG